LFIKNQGHLNSAVFKAFTCLYKNLYVSLSILCRVAYEPAEY
jgi:hypothetical protein